MQTASKVDILPAHWESFTAIVDSVGLAIDTLRTEYVEN